MAPSDEALPSYCLPFESAQVRLLPVVVVVVLPPLLLGHSGCSAGCCDSGGWRMSSCLPHLLGHHDNVGLPACRTHSA